MVLHDLPAGGIYSPKSNMVFSSPLKVHSHTYAHNPYTIEQVLKLARSFATSVIVR